LTCLLCTSAVQAQEVWDLQRCITYALENNLQIRQGELGVEIAKEDVKNNRGRLMPNLNGFASNTWNFGQTIDRFTNQFANTTVRSNNFSINSDVTVFNGFQITNTLKQSQLDLKAREFGTDKQRNDIQLQVARAYLNILFNEELLAVAQNQLRLSQQQLERTRKLSDAGSVPLGSVYDVQAQVATEELNVVSAENSLALSKLSLKQLLQLEADTDMAINKPEIVLGDGTVLPARPSAVFGMAAGVMPEVKQAEYQLASAEKGLSIAKGGRSPSLSMSGSIGTGYSGLSSEVVGFTENGTELIGNTASGEPVFAPVFETISQDVSFSDQIDQNLNRSVGLTLTIPFFNAFTTSTNIQRARLNKEIQETNLELVRYQLRQEIEQAYADAVAALKQYRASDRSVTSLQESFNYAEQRFNVGLMNAVDYSEAKNRLINAQSDRLRAKYDFVFKSKILEFYQGRPLTL
ncbi:MAG: TolC family protein, partial [Bacteroidota bacterium]